MARLDGLCFVIFIFVHKTDSVLQQKMAKLDNYDPKFVGNVSVWTRRETRRSPYLTTVNVTTLMTIQNNVTIALEFGAKYFKSIPLRIEFRTCDGFNKLPWLLDFMKEYSNVVPKCPISPDNYVFQKVPIPPPNFPYKLLDIDYFMSMEMYQTHTRKSLLRLHLELEAKKN